MEPEPAHLRDWLREHPLPDTAFVQTVAGIAARALAGDDFWVAVREFLDEFALLQTDAQRARAISDPPPLTGDAGQDAYVAALAEHLAATSRIPRPAWTVDGRFLDRFWFVSSVRGFRALALVESPAAFRRRGIFISAGSLRRC